MDKIISIDLMADFGFFRKPDVNDYKKTPISSYNIIHKPAILGIFGAIIGLDGYKEKGKMPAYYDKLRHIQIGVCPLDHEKGNYQKTVIKYSNTVGYANKGSTYLTEEATLLRPSYRIYAKLNLEEENELKLYQYLQEGKAEYLPYFGKNEHYAWWDKESFKEHIFDGDKDIADTFFIKSMFAKDNVVKDHKAEEVFDMFTFMEAEEKYMYFERLPSDFDLNLFQYTLGDFVFTTFGLKNSVGLKNLYFLREENYYVQLI